jgi:hypothetical protein
MRSIARAMIRTKPDSYCRAWDLGTNGISEMVGDLLEFYALFGIDPSSRFYRGAEHRSGQRPHALRRAWDKLAAKLDRSKSRGRRKPPITGPVKPPADLDE